MWSNEGECAQVASEVFDEIMKAKVRNYGFSGGLLDEEEYTIAFSICFGAAPSSPKVSCSKEDFVAFVLETYHRRKHNGTCSNELWDIIDAFSRNSGLVSFDDFVSAASIAGLQNELSRGVLDSLYHKMLCKSGKTSTTKLTSREFARTLDIEEI